MGTSASATVFYGYDLNRMEHPDTDESLAPAWLVSDDGTEEDPEAHLARALGWREVPFPSGAPQRRGWSLDDCAQFRAANDAFRKTPEYQEWRVNRQERRRLTEGFGVTFDTYGYLDGYERSYVAITDSKQKIVDYGSGVLDVAAMHRQSEPGGMGPDWDALLSRYVDIMDFGTAVGDQAPRWHVAVSYG